MHLVEVALPFTPPLDGEALWAYLAARTIAGVEGLDGVRYRRAVHLTSGPGVLELHRPDGEARLRGRVHLSEPVDRGEAEVLLRRTADLDRDPADVVAGLGEHPWLGPLVRARPGLRAPQHPGGFETALRAVLAQQVSLSAARTHTARLVSAAGTRLPVPVGEVTHLFPTPAQVAAVGTDAGPEESILAMPAGRRRAVLALARAVVDGLDLDGGGSADEAEAGLLAVPGIGPWTAQYVRMRALGDPDAYCGTDLVLRRAAEALGGGPADPRGTEFAPWRTYAAHHLWRHAQLEGTR
ncbi:DNA-3-methyladenine glycosylase 2 family protein [Ruania alkalisoli]|uniref:DNA-3-methyladenine glycosylase II n=1 Tax=Ruania alkalisoli TaxID=2779775 RepID=A0A7M1SV56_9MICO|nr:DNA-3-methyladenine glycosylase 2 family protein [Ruania alkalisoli]QOR71428.1 DNA-3-methyladenine glycosylase 2 family protein [Ruania alkalisoli]